MQYHTRNDTHAITCMQVMHANYACNMCYKPSEPVGSLADSADRLQTFVKLKVLNNAIPNPTEPILPKAGDHLSETWQLWSPKLNIVLTGMSYRHICQITYELTFHLPRCGKVLSINKATILAKPVGYNDLVSTQTITSDQCKLGSIYN